MQAFTVDEARAILTAAAKERSPVRRWVPLLCAQSGARVAEVCQLRREDIREEKGIWFMRITGEAGSVKNANSERDVPLHPDVIAAGFLDFVKAKPEGPLFYDPKRRREGSTKPPAKIIAKNIASWVHTLGLKVGRDHRKDPNHAWRHYFKTVARAHGIQDSVSDRITGHAASNEGQNYGGLWLETLHEAVAKLPIPGMSDEKTRDGVDPSDLA
jgi:integrase